MSKAFLAARRLARYATVPAAVMLALTAAPPAQAEPFPPYSKFQISYWTDPARCVGWANAGGSLDALENHACDARATWTYNRATQQLISNDNRCVDEWIAGILEVKSCDTNRAQQRWEVTYTTDGYYVIHQAENSRGLFWMWTHATGGGSTWVANWTGSRSAT
ncbi:hypothetical protein SANT12839_100310 [Streptomyces antimycoticus]|uniref:Ricin B lectin domain-containing protein n=1 Tax=Streptomyces antimycoticus TaxID=68175 RepID=A0A4D4KTG5_9ACTN|nr:hypothetical protein SANT12839_100310 [Streptomyces antimycoticus]